MAREPERLLTIAQAADLANCDDAAILRWIALGLPHIALGGRSRPRHADVRIKASALWAWVDTLTVRRRPAPDREGGGAKVAPVARTSNLKAWREVKRVR